MYDAFVTLLNMSLAAGVLAAVVALLRLLLKKAPRKFICILWALVALRLVCPVSIGSSLSAFNLLEHDADTNGQIEYFEYNGKTEKPMVEFSVPSLEENAAASENMVLSTRTSDIYLPMVMKLWLAGVGLMLLYALASYLRLRRKVAASMPLGDGVMASDDIAVPFLLGVFCPNVYVPSGVDETTLQYILLHEKAHIRRGDHWWKPLGWVLLSIHWFNPLIWLAYVLFCRDIEIACDERVTRNMNREGKAAYSEALLQCSVHRRCLMVCPLAFGEVGIRERVKNVLKDVKPARWIIVLAVAALAVVAVCFLTGPEAANGQKLTMEVVRRLGERGDALTWEDFEPYTWEEAESERYARKYEIDRQFELIVESYGLEHQPDSVLLRNKDINAWIDVRTGDIIAFTSTPTSGGVDGPNSVTVTQNDDFAELFARYDAGGADGEAAEAILRERQDEALKYCMHQFDAGVLEGLTLESAGAEMGMYRFWQSARTTDVLESPFEGVAEDWQEWSAYVRNLYERNGYDEELFNDTVPASKCYVEILVEEEQ